MIFRGMGVANHLTLGSQVFTWKMGDGNKCAYLTRWLEKQKELFLFGMRSMFSTVDAHHIILTSCTSCYFINLTMVVAILLASSVSLVL